MAEAPNPWDLVLARIDRLEQKVDRVGERVVPRDEFERYKATIAAELAQVRSDAKELKQAIDASKDREVDEKNRGRMFVGGMVLTPIVSTVVAWVASNGLGGAS